MQDGGDKIVGRRMYGMDIVINLRHNIWYCLIWHIHWSADDDLFQSSQYTISALSPSQCAACSLKELLISSWCAFKLLIYLFVYGLNIIHSNFQLTCSLLILYQLLVIQSHCFLQVFYFYFLISDRCVLSFASSVMSQFYHCVTGSEVTASLSQFLKIIG